MGWRFQRRVKILPGIRLNLSKRAVSSISVGARGGWLNFGRKGTRTTIGLPGTGLRYTSQIKPYRATVKPRRSNGRVEVDFGGQISEEADGRWKAEAPEFGVVAYGQTRDEAIAKLKAAGDRAIADALHEVKTLGKHASADALGKVMAFKNHLDPESRATVSAALSPSSSSRLIWLLVVGIVILVIAAALQH
jgi:predicted RNase H-like HicB family nuclease